MRAWDGLKAVVPSQNAASHPAVIVTEAIPKVLLGSEAVAETARAAYTAPFEVQKHLRNLATGSHASPEKIAAAAAHGFTLQEGQTWVESYIKGLAA